MKNIKTFDSYNKINEYGESGYYPAGTEHDPNAPWNQKDPSTQRGYEPKKEDIIFDVVGSDYKEFAMLKSKRDGKYYLMWFDPSDSDFMEYMEVEYEVVGKDEDGFAEYEYDWDNASVDDAAIAGYASVEAKDPKRMGVGLEAFEDGQIAEVDEELAKDFLKTVEDWIAKSATSPGWTWKLSKGQKESMEKVADTLRSLIPEGSEGVNEAEGIHPAVRQHLIDFLKDNPKATYAEARNHISDKIKGWKLSEEDFEEAKEI